MNGLEFFFFLLFEGALPLIAGLLVGHFLIKFLKKKYKEWKK
jgi:hypothetical protein